MPVVDISFSDGIFYSREYGVLDKDDARLWSDAAARYAAESDVPIVALIDAKEVERITPSARQIFARVSMTPNLEISVVAASDPNANRASRITGMVAINPTTFVFQDYEEARKYAIERVAEIRKRYGKPDPAISGDGTA
jgi:hypothetical protein